MERDGNERTGNEKNRRKVVGWSTTAAWRRSLKQTGKGVLVLMVVGWLMGWLVGSYGGQVAGLAAHTSHRFTRRFRPLSVVFECKVEGSLDGRLLVAESLSILLVSCRKYQLAL